MGPLSCRLGLVVFFCLFFAAAPLHAQDTGQAKSAKWWQDINLFHQQIENFLLEKFKQAELASATDKKKTHKQFKHLLLQASPDVFVMGSSGNIPLENNIVAHFSGYYHVSRLIQKLPGVERDFTFGRNYLPDMTFTDGLNSVSVRVRKKDFSSLAFSSVRIPAIAEQAKQIVRLRPQKIPSYTSPLPTLIEDYYRLDPQASGLRIDVFIERLLFDPGAREQMLRSLERIYTAQSRTTNRKNDQNPLPETNGAAPLHQRGSSPGKNAATSTGLSSFLWMLLSVGAVGAFFFFKNNDRSSQIAPEPESLVLRKKHTNAARPSQKMGQSDMETPARKKSLEKSQLKDLSLSGSVKNQRKTTSPAPEKPAMKDVFEKTTPGQPITQTEEASSPWTLNAIRRLYHRDFEILCQRYFEARGFYVEICPPNKADHGIDLKLFQNQRLRAIVQCKQYPKKKVGVNLIREFFGVMSSEKVSKGFFITSGEYTSDAQKYAGENKIDLIAGRELENELRRHGLQQDPDLIPNPPGVIACPLCNAPMDWKPKGDFWGCSTFGHTRCKGRRFTPKPAPKDTFFGI